MININRVTANSITLIRKHKKKAEIIKYPVATWVYLKSKSNQYYYCIGRKKITVLKTATKFKKIFRRDILFYKYLETVILK